MFIHPRQRIQKHFEWFKLVALLIILADAEWCEWQAFGQELKKDILRPELEGLKREKADNVSWQDYLSSVICK